MSTHLKLKRVYDPPAPEDGTRILVDRLWPRGLKKGDAAIDRWMKEIAPSTELRKWFDHDPERWAEFQRRYKHELYEHALELEELRALASKSKVTLLFAARDEQHNDAVVLQEVLIKGR